MTKLKSKTFLLLVAGLLIISGIQIASYYFEFSDIARGAFVGFGLGLMLVFLLKKNFKTAS